MENKNLDGQISLDSQLESKTPEVMVTTETQHTEEFEIGKPKITDSVVFEVEKVKDAQKNAAEVVVPVEEELIIGAATAIPEKKIASERSNESGTPQKKKQVYVPRFTEASEKYRRMIDTRTMSSQSNPLFAPKSTVATVEENVEADFTDPTAELVETTENQVFVNVTAPEPVKDGLSVFKFADNVTEKTSVAETLNETVSETDIKAETVTETSESDLEKEREAIAKLISKDTDEIDEEIKTPVTTLVDVPTVDAEVAEIIKDETALTTPVTESSVLPDPVDQVHIEEFPDSAREGKEEPVPDCVVLEEPQQDKNNQNEFTHQTQRDGFKDKFLDSIMAKKVRLFTIGMFSLGLLVFEMLASFGVISSAVFSTSGFAGTLAAMDWLFVACIFALTIPGETAKAFKYLFSGKLIPEIALPAGFVAISAYLLITILFPTSEYALYGFVFAVTAFVGAFATYYRTCGDFMAFKQVSQNTEKKVLDVKLTRELEDENVALDGLIDEYTSKTARIYHTAFVTDFFKKSSEPVVNNRRTGFMLGVSAVAALVTAIACFFIFGGIVPAFAAFALVFLLGCPAFSVLSYKISYFDSQDAVLAEESAVLGEKSYIDFSEVDVIAFEDTEIFGTEDVKLKRFMLYGNRDNIEKAMRQMYSLFSVAGGPLNKVFANALDNRVRHTPATDVEIEDDGISGNIAGSRIFAGNEEYMKRHGIPLPSVSAHSGSGVDTTKILYAAEGGEVYAKFFIRYSFSEEFTRLLPEMKSAGIVPLIYTNDPNLSNELLKTLSAGADCMRVVKKHLPRANTEKTYRRVRASVVTYGDKINAINTVLLARRYKSFADKIAVFELYSISIAAALGAILSVLGMTLPSVVFGLWHIAGCVILRFMSRKEFVLEKKEEN